MNKQHLSSGIFHQLPDDLAQAIAHDPKAIASWESISDKARNEWICWTITVKQEKTRRQHVERAVRELSEGKKRPCCWVGCIHRTDKPVGARAQKVLVDKEPDASA